MGVKVSRSTGETLRGDHVFREIFYQSILRTGGGGGGGGGGAGQAQVSLFSAVFDRHAWSESSQQ